MLIFFHKNKILKVSTKNIVKSKFFHNFILLIWLKIDIYTPPEAFDEKVSWKMEIYINKDLHINIYARLRIEEHLKKY